jgi:hypothetical protein
MGVPDGYFESEKWWWWLDGASRMPAKSVFPDKTGGPGWTIGDIPDNFGGGRGETVQGWKIHVCVHPADIEGLFVALSQLLMQNLLAHKFTPFEIYSQQKIGYAAFQRIGTDQGDSAAAKACVIYPPTPTQLGEIVPKLDQAIRQINALARGGSPVHGKTLKKMRPFPGGVKGDLPLGNTGFVYCRYGAFQGALARSNQVYDPIRNNCCADPRFTRPFPDFVKVPPVELTEVRRGR